MLDAHIYFGVAMAGFISFLSPCVLPLVPPYLGYLGGTTISQSSADEGIDDAVWRRVVLGSIFFVLGFTTVFVGLGAGASAFGQLIRAYQGILSKIAGAIIILFGLHFLGLFRVRVLYRDTRYQANMQGASFAGAYLIGLAFAFGWTPCIGPVLATVLAVAASEDSVARGVQLLFVYSLGLGVPFVLAAVAIRPFLSFLQRIKKHLVTVERIMGLMLVVTGLMFLTGTMTWVGQWLLEAFPSLVELEGWFMSDDLQKQIINGNP